MKFKNILAEIALQELGETTEAYDYYFQKARKGNVLWSFTTPNHVYEVSFINRNNEYLDSSFETRETSAGITNEGEHFRVAATVMKISAETWEKKDEFFENAEELEGFSYDAIPKPDEGFAKDVTLRDKLYRQFIRKQFPNVEIIEDGVRTLIIPNER